MRQIILAACLALSVSACTIQPLYQSNGSYSVPAIELQYSEPTNRNEQIAQQVIAERFPRSDAPDAPTIRVSVSIRSFNLSRSAGPLSNMTEVTASVAATVRSADGEVLFAETRTRSANYQRIGQTVSRDVSVLDAQERAIRAAAEDVRAQLLVWSRDELSR